jgi:predicted GNAT family N-acyltransferase
MNLEERGAAGSESSPLTIINTQFQAFEPGVIGRGGAFTFVKNPTSDGFDQIYEMATREISDNIASREVMREAMNHNPISFWGIYRSTTPARTHPKLSGFFAFLPLNGDGLAAYQAGRLKPRKPELRYLAHKGERPAALYIWAVVAHRVSVIGAQLIAHAMGIDWFFDTPIFGTIGTKSGLNAVRNASSLCVNGDDPAIGQAFEFRLPPELIEQTRKLQIVEGLRQDNQAALPEPRLETRVVNRQDDLSKAMAIRAAVFMAEQACPYSEEFDENDFVGMHLLGTVSGEPAATLRIRFFAEFAKFERWAVLPRFRGTLIGRSVVEHALKICQRKGYRRVYAHAQLRYIEKWKRFGLRPMLKNAPLVFSDYEYVEMEGELPEIENSLNLQSDPYVLIRPEGNWDCPGVLDKSASRRALSPF